MDACKAAVKALRNSPAAVRRKFHDSTSSSRRHKLREDWLNENDAVVAGITFFVKFLGCVQVSATCGQGCTDDSVRQICSSAKRQKEKLEKISMCVSAKNISMTTLLTNVRTVEYPIYRVTYCTVDSYNDKIFAFIAQCPKTLNMLCYAFLCNKKSKALAVTLSIAQAFNMAFDMWEETKERHRLETERTVVPPSLRQRTRSVGDMHRISNGHARSSRSLDLDIHLERRHHHPIALHPDTPQANGHGDVFTALGEEQLRSSSDGVVSDDELDAEFTRLAQSRSTPNLLDIGRVKPGILCSPTDDGEKIDQYKNGENNPAVLYRMISREDLLSPTSDPETPSLGISQRE